MKKIADLEISVLEKINGQSLFDSLVILVTKPEVGKWRVANNFVDQKSR